MPLNPVLLALYICALTVKTMPKSLSRKRKFYFFPSLAQPKLPALSEQGE